jgi:hypothetical protein
MLATVVALHLALAQAPQAPAAEPPPAAAAPAPAALPAPTGDAASAPLPAIEPPPATTAPGPAASAEPEPAKPAVRAEDDEQLKSSRELPPPVRMPTRPPKSALVPIPSLLSAEPLGGRSAVVAWAGWPAIGVGWAQGVTPEDDLGLTADLDWSTGELRLSAFYRRPLGRIGRAEIASRLRAGWYADFGAKWIRDDNADDRGVEFVPGIVLSGRGAGGVFSLGGDLPIAVTLWNAGGIFAAPRVSFSFEKLLYGDLTVGFRMAAAYRAGAGSAPMVEPRPLLDLQVLVGWKLL